MKWKLELTNVENFVLNISTLGKHNIDFYSSLIVTITRLKNSGLKYTGDRIYGEN